MVTRAEDSCDKRAVLIEDKQREIHGLLVIGAIRSSLLLSVGWHAGAVEVQDYGFGRNFMLRYVHKYKVDSKAVAVSFAEVVFKATDRGLGDRLATGSHAILVFDQGETKPGVMCKQLSIYDILVAAANEEYTLPKQLVE